MDEITLFTGKSEDMPKKYLEQFFALRQQEYEEKTGMLPPSIEYFRNSWKLGTFTWEEVRRTFMVNKDDQLIGIGYVSWHTKYDHLDKAWFGIHITPSERRKGNGSKMLHSLIKQLTSQILVITTDASLGTAGEYFLRNLKRDSNYEEQIVVANLEEHKIDEIEVEAIKQKQHASEKGYRIEFFENDGAGNLVEYGKYVRMVEQLWNDMPREELTYEDDVLTEEKLRGIYSHNIKRGLHYYGYLVIHDKTDEPVGYTTVAINKYQPWVAWQDDTGVIHEHRGNGLGLALKYQSLLKLLIDTKAKFWRTGNAASNVHMARINKKLGHKLFLTDLVFELDVSELRKPEN